MQRTAGARQGSTGLVWPRALGACWVTLAVAMGASCLLLAAAPVAAADDSCIYANDGECDVPPVCQAGTDATDCRRAAGAPRAAAQDATPEEDPFAAANLGRSPEIDAMAAPIAAAQGGDTAAADGLLDLAVSDWLVGGGLVAAAVIAWLRGIAAPRSGLLAVALLLMAAGTTWIYRMPYELLRPLLELAAMVDVELHQLLLFAGIALLLYVLARLGSTAPAGSSLQTMARAALGPDIVTSDHEEISAARRLCQAAAQRLEEQLRAQEGRFHLYAQYEAVSEPWLQVDRLSSDPRGAFVASLRVDFKPQPFRTHPVVVDLAVDDRGRRRRVTSIVEFGHPQVDALAACLTGVGPRFRWRGQRLREWPWQLWRPRQGFAVLESPFLAGLRANIKLVLVLLVAALVLAGWLAEPIGVSVLLVVAFLAWRHWYVPPPNYRVANGRPSRPPRSLRALDSWQAVLRDLGAQRDEVVQRLESSLEQRMAGTDEPVQIRREDIWYQGADGKVERQQLTISLRRAIVFVRIYRYGSDLFVGWDAHVNLLAWKESPVQTGHRASDGLKVQLVAVTTEAQPINEYDITDANFLLEATHLHLTTLLKDVLREREIEQELDFSIVRESRQNLVAAPAQQPQRRRMFSRA